MRRSLPLLVAAVLLSTSPALFAQTFRSFNRTSIGGPSGLVTRTSTTIASPRGRLTINRISGSGNRGNFGGVEVTVSGRRGSITFGRTRTDRRGDEHRFDGYRGYRYGDRDDFHHDHHHHRPHVGRTRILHTRDGRTIFLGPVLRP